MYVKTLTTLIVSIMFLALPLNAQVKNKKSKAPESATQPVDLKASQVGDTGPVLTFDAGDAPAQKDDRGTLKFTDGSLNPSSKEQSKAMPTNETPPDEQGFKSYIGYPAHEFALLTGVDSISATFSYQNQDFNFSTTTFAYGFAYNLVATPSWKVGLMYLQYNIGVNAGTASALNIVESDETLSQFGVTTEYCSIGATNFYRQLCFGGLVMKDAYPMLNFTGGSTLAMSKLEDIVLGLNASYQMPLTDKLLFKPIIGFNYGMASGDSGTLTPKSNSKFYLRTELPWLMSESMVLRFHGDFSLRKAEAEGTTGSNFDPWETNSANLGVGADLVIRL